MIFINDYDFNKEYVDDLVELNSCVLFYFCNDSIKKKIPFVIEKNIEIIKKVHNPDTIVYITVNDIKKIEEVLNFKDIKLPTILVIQNKEVIEFLNDCILVEK